jgi:hypothetical protein
MGNEQRVSAGTDTDNRHSPERAIAEIRCVSAGCWIGDAHAPPRSGRPYRTRFRFHFSPALTRWAGCWASPDGDSLKTRGARAAVKAAAGAERSEGSLDGEHGPEAGGWKEDTDASNVSRSPVADAL